MACQEQGCDALELNLSCPHMDRPDMGSNVGKDKELVSIVTKVVKEVAKMPVWAKLTPSTTDIVVEARGAFLGGADAIVSSNTFTSLPLIDAETLEFEVHVDGLVSTGGLGGPAILPLSLAKMSQLTQAFPDKSFSGIGGISTFEHALNYFLLGCGTVQVCTAAMLDHAIGPNVIRELNDGLARFLEKHADKGWTRVDDFVGLRRDRVVAQSKIRRPDEKDYRGGYEARRIRGARDDVRARRGGSRFPLARFLWKTTRDLFSRDRVDPRRPTGGLPAGRRATSRPRSRGVRQTRPRAWRARRRIRSTSTPARPNGWPRRARNGLRFAEIKRSASAARSTS